MTSILDAVMAELRSLSPEALAAEIASYRDSDIALTLREIEAIASSSCTRLEKLFEINNKLSILLVKHEHYTDYSIVLEAANDQRFALAA